MVQNEIVIPALSSCHLFVLGEYEMVNDGSSWSAKRCASKRRAARRAIESLKFPWKGEQSFHLAHCLCVPVSVNEAVASHLHFPCRYWKADNEQREQDKQSVPSVVMWWSKLYRSLQGKAVLVLALSSLAVPPWSDPACRVSPAGRSGRRVLFESDTVLCNLDKLTQDVGRHLSQNCCLLLLSTYGCCQRPKENLLTVRGEMSFEAATFLDRKQAVSSQLPHTLPWAAVRLESESEGA